MLETSVAPYHAQGFLSRAIRWVRKYADEPVVGNTKYTDYDLSVMLSHAMNPVLNDLYSMASNPPVARVSYTTVAGQDYYAFPPNVGEFRRLANISSVNNMPIWEIVPRPDDTPAGPGVLIEGLAGFRLVPTPQSGGDTIVLDYVPSGVLYPHQNAAPLWTKANDTGDPQLTLSTDGSSSYFYLNPRPTAWKLGMYDPRPNAYLGQVVRILGTINDSVPTSVGAPLFPVQERIATAYDLFTSCRATLKPGLSSQLFVSGDPTPVSDPVANSVVGVTYGESPRTWVVYEVLPAVDPAVLWLAMLQVAIELCTIEQKKSKVPGLMAIQMKQARAAQLRWANTNMRTGLSMNTKNWDSDPEDFGWMF